MDKNKALQAWDDELEEKAAPNLGANRELVRKVMALNPSLRETSDSSAALDRLQLAKYMAAKTTQAAAGPEARNLTETVSALKTELDGKAKAIASERAALDQRERELRPDVCGRFIDALLKIDPNLTSPKTEYILRQEKSFLDGIGFSMQKLVECEARKR